MGQERAKVRHKNVMKGEMSAVPKSIEDVFQQLDPGLRGYLESALNTLLDTKEAIDKVLAVATTDPNGIITSVNEKFCQLYKYSPEEVIGKTHRMLKSGEHSEEFYRNLWRTITSGNIFEGDIKNQAKDGTSHWAHMVIVPFLNEEGKIYQYVSFRTDITPIKEAEEQRVRLVEAESAIQARDRFVSMAAHELKTPITSLQMVLDLLARQAKDQSSERDLGIINRLTNTASFQARRLTSIINDLLDVSRITAGKLQLKRELIDLGELVEELIAFSKADFDAAGCQVSLEVQKHVQGVWDKDRLQQVIINLISNAMKYGQRKPIQIIIESDGAWAKIKVKDHGIGIAPDFQRHLFQRFERSDTAQHFKGIGLGLWITYQIVDAHRGKIHVESEEGKGATFIVELPIREKHPWPGNSESAPNHFPERRSHREGGDF